MKIWALLFTVFLALAGFNAEAKRLAGGQSAGKQSGNVTQRESAPAQSAAKPGAAPAAAGAAAAAVAAMAAVFFAGDDCPRCGFALVSVPLPQGLDAL